MPSFCGFPSPPTTTSANLAVSFTLINPPHQVLTFATNRNSALNVTLGRIRATVRAGRERMRNTLLSWLPVDLRGARLLDAGCGTGALAVLAAQRGAQVVAIDLSPTLVGLARERQPAIEGAG